jgi:hypothetical protein
MKKLLFIAAALVGLQLSAQVKSLEGLKLTKTEDSVYDFEIPAGNDKLAYDLVCNLAQECESFSDLPQEVIGKKAIHGFYFRFKDQDVVYILYKGGRVAGALIEKKKGA